MPVFDAPPDVELDAPLLLEPDGDVALLSADDALLDRLDAAEESELAALEAAELTDDAAELAEEPSEDVAEDAPEEAAGRI